MPPKYDSNRILSLDEETLEILRREKQRQQSDREKDENYITVLYDGKRINYDEGKAVDFVIKLDHGDFKSPNTRQHIAQVIHKELGMPFTYHSLRHTHATILAEGGHDPFYIKERLGHKSLEITLKYYLHSTKGTRKAAKPKLEEIMKAFSINNTAQENS